MILSEELASAYTISKLEKKFQSLWVLPKNIGQTWRLQKQRKIGSLFSYWYTHQLCNCTAAILGTKLNWTELNWTKTKESKRKRNLLNSSEKLIYYIKGTCKLLLYLSCKWPPNAHTNAKANELTTLPVSLAEIPELCLLLIELTDWRCFWLIICIWLSSSSRRMCRS